MVNVRFILVLVTTAIPHALVAEDLGEMWGTAQEEEKYYPIVNIPIPPEVPMRPGSFEILPDGRLAVVTGRCRRVCAMGGGLFSSRIISMLDM